MITINLIPKELRPRPQGWTASLSPRKIAVIVIFGFVSVTALFGVWRISIQKTYAQLNVEWKQMQAQKMEWETLRDRIGLLEAQEAQMKQLRMTALRWAPRMEILSEALVPDIWFTKLELQPVDLKKEAREETKKGKKKTKETKAQTAPAKGKAAAGKRINLLVRGVALVPTSGVEPSPISVYLQSLKKHPRFSQHFDAVEVKSVERNKIGSTDISEFFLQLDVTERAS